MFVRTARLAQIYLAIAGVLVALMCLAAAPSQTTSSQTASSQTTPSKTAPQRLAFDKAKLPAGLKYTGTVVDGAHWQDDSGENLLLMTQTGAFNSKKAESEDEHDAEVYAYHFVRKQGQWTLLWKIVDFVRNCPVDLYAGFIPGSFTLTDLDADGIAETAFLYRLSCRGDVSPAQLKLMLHEGAKKYAIRGHTVLPPEWSMGTNEEMKLDAAFNKAPKSFREHAVALWRKHMTEKTMLQF